MKKSTFLSCLLLCLFFSSPLFSQTWSWGIQAGGNYTDFTGDDNAVDFGNAKAGFQAGAKLTWFSPGKIFLGTEINWERKRGGSDILLTDENGEPLEDTEAIGNFDYLTLPVLVGYFPGNQRRFYLQAGTSFAYLLSQKVVFDSEFFDDFDGKANYKSVDVLATAGLGALLLLNEKIRLSVAARSSFGLLNINEKYPGKMQSISIQGLAGLEFNLN
jgi:hypothetical protein